MSKKRINKTQNTSRQTENACWRPTKITKCKQTITKHEYMKRVDGGRYCALEILYGNTIQCGYRTSTSTPPKPSLPSPAPGHERFGSMLLCGWLGGRGQPLTRWWTERPCSGMSRLKLHSQVHSRSMRNVSSVAGSVRTMSGSLSMCSPSSVKGSIFNSSNGNWESASKLTSPTLANELVRSLERLGGDSPVTSVRQIKNAS